MKDLAILGVLVLVMGFVLSHAAADKAKKEEIEYRSNHLHIPPLEPEPEELGPEHPSREAKPILASNKQKSKSRRPVNLTPREKFVYDISQIALEESERLDWKIPPSLIVAQAILESRYGESRLATKANNFFGHKWKRGHGIGYIRADDDQPQEPFTKYKSRWYSIRAHVKILMGPLYYGRLKGKPTLENWLNALCGNSDPVKSKKFIKAGGSVYATACFNSCYACKVRSIVKEWNLERLDRMAP